MHKEKKRKAAEENGGGNDYLDTIIQIICFLAGFSVTTLIIEYFNLI